MRNLTLSLLIALIMSPNSLFGEALPFVDDRHRGFNWFEMHEQAKDEEPLKPMEDINPSSNVHPATKARKALGKKAEEALDVLIMNPTSIEAARNVKQIHKELFNRTSQASRTAKIAELMYPDLDYQMISPNSHKAMEIRNREVLSSKADAVKRLSKTHGLVFFYVGEDEYSQLMAKTMRRFQTKYSLDVSAVTIDGVILPEFPDSMVNNDLANKLRITRAPAVIAVNPKTAEFFPIANRASSISEMEQVTLGFELFKRKEKAW